jgi:hypothetical protein
MTFLYLSSDISANKFERVDLIGPQAIKLYNKSGMVTDCSIIYKAISRGHETENFTFDKSISG